MIRIRKIWMAMLVLAILLAGCSSTETRDSNVGNDTRDSETVSPGQSGSARTEGAQMSRTWRGQPLDDPESLLATRKIYFDFDRSEIRADFLSILDAHADFLLQNTTQRVLIEGHCDERGSREYNIALGERRAAAIKNYLEAAGVSALQIDTISYGEERPQNPGHDEAAWALNRRGVLVY